MLCPLWHCSYQQSIMAGQQNLLQACIFLLGAQGVPEESYNSAGKMVISLGITPVSMPVGCVLPILWGRLQEPNCRVSERFKGTRSKSRVSDISSSRTHGKKLGPFLDSENWDCGDQQSLSSHLLPPSEEEPVHQSTILKRIPCLSLKPTN